MFRFFARIGRRCGDRREPGRVFADPFPHIPLPQGIRKTPELRDQGRPGTGRRLGLLRWQHEPHVHAEVYGHLIRLGRAAASIARKSVAIAKGEKHQDR